MKLKLRNVSDHSWRRGCRPYRPARQIVERQRDRGWGMDRNLCRLRHRRLRDRRMAERRAIMRADRLAMLRGRNCHFLAMPRSCAHWLGMRHIAPDHTLQGKRHPQQQGEQWCGNQIAKHGCNIVGRVLGARRNSAAALRLNLFVAPPLRG